MNKSKIFADLVAFAEVVNGAMLTPWQRAALVSVVENEQCKLENTLLYGDPEVRTRPAGFTQAIAGTQPRRIVIDEIADFDNGRHALALRKLHKENVLGAIVSAPV